MKKIFTVLVFISLVGCASVPNTFPDVVEATTPSVVFILNTLKKGENPANGRPSKPDEDSGESVASGTGFIVEGDHIITNYHVVENSEKLEVLFDHDPKRYKVSIIGYDKAIDIAVLKFEEEKHVQPLKWSTIPARPGQDVWIYGHPIGLTFSVSKGIVSHTDRRITGPWQQTIQTDAAINHGNSGGPMLNMNGDVLGVSVMLISKSDSFAGIGLAIDGEIAKRAIKDILADGKINRPLMGVMLEYDRDMFVVKAGDLTKGGAADIAGIKPGDIYKEIDGSPITRINDVFDVLATKKPGDVIAVSVQRNKANKIINVTLGALPDEEPTKP